MLVCVAGCGTSVSESTSSAVPTASDAAVTATLSVAPTAPQTTVADSAVSTAVAPPSSSTTSTLAPVEAEIEHAADLIGLSFSVPLSTTVIETRLHLRDGMNISTQSLLMDASGPYGSAFDIVVDPSAEYGPGSSILVFAAAEAASRIGLRHDAHGHGRT